MLHTQLPETGFVRLKQILGDYRFVIKDPADGSAISPEFTARKDAEGELKKLLRAHPRATIVKETKTPPILPICRATWWNGIRAGRYPKPIKLGPRTTVWRVEDVREVIENAGEHNEAVAA